VHALGHVHGHVGKGVHFRSVVVPGQVQNAMGQKPGKVEAGILPVQKGLARQRFNGEEQCA